MESFCRTCFLPISETSSLDPLDQENYKYQLMFCIPEMDLRGFTIVKLCKDCIAALDITYKFKTKCLDVEKNLPIWCNAFVKLESNDLEDYTIKQEELDLVDEDEVTEDVTDQITNTTLISLNTEESYKFKTKCLDVEKDSPIWCNAFVKLESNDLEDYTIKQEELDLVDEDEVTEGVTDQITNTTLISLNTEEPYKFKTKCLDVENNSPIWNNAFVKLESNDVEDYTIKQKKFDLVDEDKVTKDVTHKITNTTLISSNTEEPYKFKTKCLDVENNSPIWNNAFVKLGSNDVEDYTIKQKKLDLVDEDKVTKDVTRKITTTTLIVLNIKKPKLCECIEKPSKYQNCKCNKLNTLSSSNKLTNNINYLKHDYTVTQKHILFEHNYSSPYKKQLCENSSARKFDLKRHIHSYTCKNPFKCPLCVYRASNKNDLKRHIRTHKPFKCITCGHSAPNISTLNKHILKHIDVRPIRAAKIRRSFKKTVK